jgi:hypothetical protein
VRANLYDDGRLVRTLYVPDSRRWVYLAVASSPRNWLDADPLETIESAVQTHQFEMVARFDDEADFVRVR